MAPLHSARNGLVLTGGGARAAYQVGALMALARITRSLENPFQVISGFSAGAINGAWLASRGASFEQDTTDMWQAWAKITTDQIFKADALSLFGIGFQWLKDRTMGGLSPQHQITYLLNTSPLRKFLNSQIDFEKLHKNVEDGRFHAISVTAVSYVSGHSTTFFSGDRRIETWQSLNRRSERAKLGPQHVLASAAIPIFFPPVRIGNDFFGDGMVRLNAPLSSAIHLGAKKLLVIGVRGPSSASTEPHQPVTSVSISEIAGTILNGLFFDSLDADLARMDRINRTLSVLSEDELLQQPDHLRVIPLLSLKPSEEIGDLAICQLSRIPSALRHLLKGIGLSEDRGKDLLSYLSFEPKFIRTLLELGYEDTLRHKIEVLEFFERSEDPRKKERGPETEPLIATSP
mgnify:CR=1 FL=1